MGSFPERVLVVLHSTRKPCHVLLSSHAVHFEVEFTKLIGRHRDALDQLTNLQPHVMIRHTAEMEIERELLKRT